MSEEALIGMRVRVHESLMRADLRGLEGDGDIPATWPWTCS